MKILPVGVVSCVRKYRLDEANSRFS